MPMYRIPATGEHFEQITPYAAPPGLAQLYAPPKRRSPQRALGTGSALVRLVSVQARQRRIIERMRLAQATPSTPAHSMTLDEFLDSTPDLEIASVNLPAATPALSGTYRQRLRRKGDGSIKAIAFYTIGDPIKSAYWREYAEAFVSGKGDQVFGVQTQADAAAKLKNVVDADVREVYFVGHGLTPDAKTNKLTEPAYMLSGQSHSGHFSATSYAQLVTPRAGPLVRALAPLLSLEHQVIVRFLACDCGTGNKLQAGFAGSLSKLAPGVDVRVEGYAGKYMVKLDHSKAAYVEDDDHHSVDHVSARTLTRDFFPTDVPPTELVVEMMSGSKVTPHHEDPFKDVDFDSQDPLESL